MLEVLLTSISVFLTIQADVARQFLTKSVFNQPSGSVGGPIFVVSLVEKLNDYSFDISLL